MFKIYTFPVCKFYIKKRTTNTFYTLVNYMNAKCLVVKCTIVWRLFCNESKNKMDWWLHWKMSKWVKCDIKQIEQNVNCKQSCHLGGWKSNTQGSLPFHSGTEWWLLQTKWEDTLSSWDSTWQAEISLLPTVCICQRQWFSALDISWETLVQGQVHFLLSFLFTQLPNVNHRSTGRLAPLFLTPWHLSDFSTARNRSEIGVLFTQVLFFAMLFQKHALL